MTHNEKLDSILNVYLHGQKLKLSNDPTYCKLTFALIVRRLAPDTDDWELEFLRNRLVTDGYLKYSDSINIEPMELTPEGIKFRQTSGYVKTQSNEQRDNEIKEQTLTSLRRSNKALWTSYFSMAGTVGAAIISLVALVNTRQQQSIEQVNKMQTRIEELTNDLLQTNNTLDSVSLFRQTADTTAKNLHP